MSDRDILLERLERKLVEKEKEIDELRKILSLNEQTITQFKKEIVEELRMEILESKKFKNLESKVVELSKAVESLTKEVLYLKSELKTDLKKVNKEEKFKDEIIIDKIDEEVEFDEDEDIIVCD